MTLASLAVCELRTCSDEFLPPSIQTWLRRPPHFLVPERVLGRNGSGGAAVCS